MLLCVHKRPKGKSGSLKSQATERVNHPFVHGEKRWGRGGWGGSVRFHWDLIDAQK